MMFLMKTERKVCYLSVVPSHTTTLEGQSEQGHPGLCDGIAEMGTDTRLVMVVQLPGLCMHLKHR